MGLDVAGRTIACKEIGGDYFDFLREQQCAVDSFNAVVGDVTDHGVDAALLMTTARAFLRMRASQCGSISQIITEMNYRLETDFSSTGRFMTMFYNTDLQRGQIIAVGADGIWEVCNMDGRMFGKRRFREIIRKNAHRSAGQILDAVYNDLSRFTKGIRQADDITLVVIKASDFLGVPDNWEI